MQQGARCTAKINKFSKCNLSLTASVYVFVCGLGGLSRFVVLLNPFFSLYPRVAYGVKRA